MRGKLLARHPHVVVRPILLHIHLPMPACQRHQSVYTARPSWHSKSQGDVGGPQSSRVNSCYTRFSHLRNALPLLIQFPHPSTFKSDLEWNDSLSVPPSKDREDQVRQQPARRANTRIQNIRTPYTYTFCPIQEAGGSQSHRHEARNANTCTRARTPPRTVCDSPATGARNRRMGTSSCTHHPLLQKNI